MERHQVVAWNVNTVTQGLLAVLYRTGMVHFSGMESTPTVGEAALKVVTRRYFIDLSMRTMSRLLAF